MPRSLTHHHRSVSRGLPLACTCVTAMAALPLWAGPPADVPNARTVHATPAQINDTSRLTRPAQRAAGVLNVHPLRPEVCFAPGTPEEVVQTVEQMRGSWGGQSAYQFADAARWSSTAHQPDGPLAQGEPTILSWSIVPDGTSIAAFNPGIGESNDPSNLIAFLDGIYGGSNETDLQFKPWFSIFEDTFARWGELTGNTYIYEPNDDGRRFGLITWPGVVGVRGDVRIGGHAIDGNSGVLAYNFYPDVGNMVIDTSDNFYENTIIDSRRLRNVLMHEHGHGLGIAHVCPVDQTKLMEPFFSSLFLGPQFDDILAGQRGYGDPNEPNDTPDQATFLSTPENGSYEVTGVSIDDESDADWYRIDLEADKQLAVTVTPLGTTYLSGPQLLSGACTPGIPFDAAAEQDLGVEVIWVDGATVLARADDHPPGEAETIAALHLGAQAGSFFIRVFGTTPDKVQMYALSYTVSDATPGPPRLMAAASRKRHESYAGDAAEYDLPLALIGDPTVEPRQGGVDQVILRFDAPVALSCDEVTLTGATCDEAVDLGAQTTWELRLSGVSSNACETLALQAGLGLDPDGPSNLSMLNILGDVDQSGGVNVVDLAAVRNALRGTVNGEVDESTFLLDVQLSNTLNVLDLNVVKANVGSSATCTP